MAIDDLVGVSRSGVNAVIQVLIEGSPGVERRDVIEVGVKEVVVGTCVGRRLKTRIGPDAVDCLGHVDLALVRLVVEKRHLWAEGLGVSTRKTLWTTGGGRGKKLTKRTIFPFEGERFDDSSCSVACLCMALLILLPGGFPGGPVPRL
jgi:hypothetical protein